MKSFWSALFILISLSAHADIVDRFEKKSDYTRLLKRIEQGKLEKVSLTERKEIVAKAIADLSQVQADLQNSNQVQIDRDTKYRIAAGALTVAFGSATTVQLLRFLSNSEATVPLAVLPDFTVLGLSIMMLPVSAFEEAILGSRYLRSAFNKTYENVTMPLMRKSVLDVKNPIARRALMSVDLVILTWITKSLVQYAWTSKDTIEVDEDQKKEIETILEQMQNQLKHYQTTLGDV